MGKTTLYHPVSLAVIRGAAEYAGFKLGKLRQVDVDESQGMAQYETVIRDLPADAGIIGPETLRAKLDSCFAADVGVLRVWYTRHGEWMASIETLSGAALEKGYSAASKADPRTPIDVSDIPF